MTDTARNLDSDQSNPSSALDIATAAIAHVYESPAEPFAKEAAVAVLDALEDADWTVIRNDALGDQINNRVERVASRRAADERARILAIIEDTVAGWALEELRRRIEANDE